MYLISLSVQILILRLVLLPKHKQYTWKCGNIYARAWSSLSVCLGVEQLGGMWVCYTLRKRQRVLLGDGEELNHMRYEGKILIGFSLSNLS